MTYLVKGAKSMEVSTLPHLTTLRLDLESDDGQTWPFVHTKRQVVVGTDSAVCEAQTWDGTFSTKLPIRPLPLPSTPDLIVKVQETVVRTLSIRDQTIKLPRQDGSASGALGRTRRQSHQAGASGLETPFR